MSTQTGGSDNQNHKAGWRVAEWARVVGISRALTYELLASGPDLVGQARIGTDYHDHTGRVSGVFVSRRHRAA